MKHWKLILLIVWITGLILFLNYYVLPKEQTVEISEVQSLKHDNEDLTVMIKLLDVEIDLLKTEADSLQHQIKYSNQTIKKLQHDLDKKINTIHSMSDVELYGYFSEFKTDSTAH